MIEPEVAGEIGGHSKIKYKDEMIDTEILKLMS
jgi:hypothetical protein